MTEEPGTIERLLVDYYGATAPAACAESIPLEQYAAEGLAPTERAAVESHIDSCAACRAALELYHSVSDLWAPKARSASTVTESSWLARLRDWIARPMVLAPTALAAAAVLAIVLFPGDADEPAALHAKGGFKLHVAVDRQGHSFRLTDGELLLTGDRLGLFYSAERVGHLTVVYLDAEGGTVRLFPALTDSSAAIEPGSEVRLPDGALLSPGHDCEWVIALFSSSPLSASEVDRSVRAMWQGRQLCALAPSALAQVDVQVVEVRR